MLSKLKKDNKGFTIIEVMIVLAIAGLIILIVLLAIPALQRNSRNTTLKNDASAIAAGVSEFKSNNDGNAPTTISATTVSGAAGTANVTMKLSNGATPTSTATPAAGALGYQIGTACPGSATSTRSVSVYYTPESTGTTITKCVDA